MERPIIFTFIRQKAGSNNRKAKETNARKKSNTKTQEHGAKSTAAGDDTRQHLRSANRELLAVPCYRLNTYGRRAFSVAGPTVWNSLQDFILDATISAESIRHLLKTYLFARY